MYHDQVSDRGQVVLHKLATALFADDKDRLMRDVQELPSGLPGTSYADPAAKRFPCHTKEATLRSAAYFYGQRAFGETFDSAYPAEKVAERIDRAAAFFGLGEDVATIRRNAEASAVKSGAQISLPPEAYAIDEVYRDKPVRRFPMFNSVSTVKAAAAVVRYRRNYPYTWRKKAASRVLEAAMAYDTPLDADTLKTLSRMAGLFPSSQKAAQLSLQTFSDVFRGKAAEAIRGAAEAVAKSADYNQETRDTLCVLVDKLAADLLPEGRPMVEDAVYADKPEADNQPPKTVDLITGNTYDLAALLQVPQDMYRVLGDDVASALVDASGALDAYKMADVLPTLPLPDAKILEDALKGVSVAPITEEKAAKLRRKGTTLFDDQEGWDEFLTSRNDKPAKSKNSRFVLTAPLRHDQDVHDYLTVV